MDDILKFVFDNYGKEIADFFDGEYNLTVSFFAESDEFVDSIKSEPTNVLKYNKFNSDFDYKVKFIQDYSLKEDRKHVISDINYCTINDMSFIKFVTPFTFDRAYDFLLGRTSEMELILKELKEREEKKNFKFNESIPIIGFDFEKIQKETIEFLENEEFRSYCRDKHIKLKRGIALQGQPGTGKTLTLQWLRNEATKKGIAYHQFKTVKEFLNDIDEYYEEGKKIFVFEDFDAAIMERTETHNSPSEILGIILNTLEGVEEINDVVSIFTTNNIDMFDSAFIRPGRIDKVFDYNLPTKENYLEFFKAYIPEENEYFTKMIEHLSLLNADISYATLKGICDDINIYKFSEENLTIKEIISIIKNKVSGANKAKEAGNSKDYML